MKVNGMEGMGCVLICGKYSDEERRIKDTVNSLDVHYKLHM